MSPVLLDTNAYSNFAKEKNKELLDEIAIASMVYISAISLGELYSGFMKGNRFIENSERLSDFLLEDDVEKVDITRETAEIYGELKYKLQMKGTPIPTNDIWIAANAIETGSKIITFDRHFLAIPGARVWKDL